VGIAEQLSKAAISALTRLRAVQLPAGTFHYLYYADKERISKKPLNIVRMAGTVYSVAWASNSTLAASCPWLGEMLERSLDFLLFACRYTPDRFSVVEFSSDKGFGEKHPLGASALLANALLLRRRSSDLDDSIEKLMRSILSSQNDNGSFSADLNNSSQLGSQRYYPGESLLALARYAQLTGDPGLWASIDKSLDYYQQLFRFDRQPAYVLWHVDVWTRCATELMLKGETEALSRVDSYMGFAKELVSYVYENYIRKLLSAPEGAAEAHKVGASLTLYVEAISRYCQASLLLGRTQAAEELLQGLLAGTRAMMGLQISESEAASLKKKDFAIGGCRSNTQSWTLRIDNDQHLITACLALLESGLTNSLDELMVDK
jgi:hypothetical protein